MKEFPTLYQIILKEMFPSPEVQLERLRAENQMLIQRQELAKATEVLLKISRAMLSSAFTHFLKENYKIELTDEEIAKIAKIDEKLHERDFGKMFKKEMGIKT